MGVSTGCAAARAARETLRVFLVEDAELIRERLCSMLDSVTGVEVAGYAATAGDAIGGILDTKPDVVLLDLKLKAGSGIDVLRAVKRRMPALAVIVLTNYATEQYRKRCLEAGAEYFLDKTNEFDQLRPILQQFKNAQGELPC